MVVMLWHGHRSANTNPSLLTVGNTCAVREPPAVIPAEHSARLIELGYMVDLEGRLRMTSNGRIRIHAGQLAN